MGDNLILYHLVSICWSFCQMYLSFLRNLIGCQKDSTFIFCHQNEILDKKPIQYYHCRILEKCHLLNFENFRLFSNVCVVYKLWNDLAHPRLLLNFIYFVVRTPWLRVRLKNLLKSTQLCNHWLCILLVLLSNKHMVLTW